MNWPIRVAQVVGRMKGAGVETTIMNHYKHIDRSKVQFDFVVQEDSTDVPIDEIQSLGGRVFFVPSYKNTLHYEKECIKLFLDIKPDIVHSGLNALSVFPLRAAKEAGVNVRIAHSHSTASVHEHGKWLVKNCLRPFSLIYPTHYAACSMHAAKWLFGNKLVDKGQIFYMRNAIDLNKFTYDMRSRERIRKKIGAKDSTIVIGQVGRLSKQKNQQFSIKVLKKILNINSDVKMVFVGDNDGLNLGSMISSLGLDGKVYIEGLQHDTAQYYSSFDVLLFPSIYEGFGMASVEAQATGLPVLSSDKVPEETILLPHLVNRLSLHISTEKWAEMILKIVEISKKNPRTSEKEIIFNAGYEINESASRLCNWYIDIMDGKKNI